MTITVMLLDAVRPLCRQPHAWQQRIETRARLGALTRRQLGDIGLNPDAVACEVQKPFWRPLGAILGEAWGDPGGAGRPSSVTVARQMPPALRPASTFPAVLLPWRS